jgi:hypothetical protein
VITGDSEIQQEVFSWQMREDPFDGILGDADRAKLRELLFERSCQAQDRHGERSQIPATIPAQRRRLFR